MKKISLESHATIIEIPRGYGFLAALDQLKESEAEIIELWPILHEGQKTATINADDILQLQQKTRGKNSRQQIFVLLDAEKMTESAQSKFLKTLEEPRLNLKFVLVVESSENLLTTIRSRCQTFRLPPISELQSIQLIKKFKLDQIKAQQILFLAKGLPGELEKLASDKKYFNQKLEQIELAKKWLAGDRFSRLEIIAELKNDRLRALEFIELCLKISQAKLSLSSVNQLIPTTAKLLKAHRKISQNHQVRLTLLAACF